jgi:membrane AbrB-like protein
MLILFSIGIVGWYLFALLNAPVAPLLGAFFLLGALRAVGVNLPLSPVFLSPAVQVAIGLFVGSQITRETVRELKTAIIPALIIAAWALGVVFVIGGFLARVTHLDLYTAMLSSSMGGLPEMAVLAIATNAEVAVVIIMFTFRLVISVLAFPMIFKYWLAGNRLEHEEKPNESAGGKGEDFDIRAVPGLLLNPKKWQQVAARCREFISFLFNVTSVPAYHLGRDVFTLGMAGGGAFLFHQMGVPAGIMVGAMVFSVITSLAGVRIQFRSPVVFGFLLVGVGIMIADNISTKTLEVLLYSNLVWPMVLSTLLIFFSSFLVAFVIHKLSGWDYPTSFLAAAPAGLTAMTALAVSYGKNPLYVSSLHLCRLVVLKTTVPLIFMFII